MAISVFEKLVKNKTIKKSDKVVIISTAHGLKFVDSKIDYHLEKLTGISNTYSNLPINVDNSIDDVMKVLDTEIK